jgi:hypothetical protein
VIPWALDVWSVLAAALVRVAMVRLVVITAPGVEVLPWDPSKCRHDRRLTCSGRLGCRVDEAAARRYEDELQKNWRLLRTAVVTAVGRAGYRSPLLALVLEDQKRGVVHYNVVLEDGPAGALAHRLLAEKASAYGFGFVDRDVKRMPGARAAGYLAGYLTNKGEKKGDASLQSVAARWSARRRIWWVSPRLTKQTHVTMTALRCGRRVMAAHAGLCEMPVEGVAIVGWRAVDMSSGAVLHEVWAREDAEEAAARTAFAYDQMSRTTVVA